MTTSQRKEAWISDLERSVYAPQLVKDNLLYPSVVGKVKITLKSCQSPKTAYLIEDIPVKPQNRHRRFSVSKYPFAQLPVGWSFFVPENEAKAARASTHAWAYRHGVKLETETIFDKQGRYVGIRIGRTK